MGKKIFLTSHLNLFSFQLMPVVSHPPSMSHCTGPGSTSSIPPCRHRLFTALQKLLLLQAGHPQLPLPLLTEQVLQFPTIMVALSWTHPQLSVSAWDWRPKTASPLFYSIPTGWCKYLENGKLLPSVFFPSWSQLPSQISVLLKGLPCTGAVGWEGVCSAVTPAHASGDGRVIEPLCLIFISQTFRKGQRRVCFFLLYFFICSWTAASFSWVLSFLNQYDLESHSFSDCFAWL